jgi:hypothetical protein
MMNKKVRGKMNQMLVKAIHEIETLYKVFQKYLALSHAEIMSAVSLISCEYQFCKYLTIKITINLIGLTYVKAGIIYQ